jgi:hypothetical protein
MGLQCLIVVRNLCLDLEFELVLEMMVLFVMMVVVL